MSLAAVLAAFAIGVGSAPGYFHRPWNGCKSVSTGGIGLHDPAQFGVYAFSLQQPDGNCWSLLNLNHRPTHLRDVCELGLHEGGHLVGLSHNPDPTSVMHSPLILHPSVRPCRRYR